MIRIARHLGLAIGVLSLASLVDCSSPEASLPGGGSIGSGETTGESKAELTTTCPDPKSCGGWSTYYDVGAPYCVTTKISCDGEPPWIHQATFQRRSSFRDCTLLDQTHCRETVTTAVAVETCGCFL